MSPALQIFFTIEPPGKPWGMVNTAVKSEETEATELNNLVNAIQLINARAKVENQ